MLHGDRKGPPAWPTDGTKKAGASFITEAWQVLASLQTAQSNNPDPLNWQAIVQQISRTIQADHGFILPLHAQTPLPVEFEYHHHSLPSWKTCPYLQQAALGRIIAQTDVSLDTELDLHWRAFFEHNHIRGIIAYPIMHSDHPQRVLVFYTESPRQWSKDELCFLQCCANHLALALYQENEKHLSAQTSPRVTAHHTDLPYSTQEKLALYAKKLEISNRELEQFATIASHDLQEPLRKIQIFSQLVAENCNKTGQEHITRLQASVEHMQSLLNDLLALSRIHRQGKPFRPVDLNRCLHTALHTLEAPIQALEPTLQVNPLATLEADAQQMEQLFAHLIGNSLKFHRPGQHLHIGITGQQTDDHYEITITDNGIGFLEQYQHRIFEPFECLHGRSSHYSGTGMGLTICRKIVERHNGAITARSGKEAGATLIITLPLRQT